MLSATLHAVPAAVPSVPEVVALTDRRDEAGDPQTAEGLEGSGRTLAREEAQEAARYAVLRRLGPAIRHQIAGALQPISMMASMLERRAQKESLDLGVLRRNAGEMSSLSRAASAECVALLGWVALTQDEPVAIGEGIADCLQLQTTELSLRGFTLVNDAQDQASLVGRSRLRALFPAVVMALTDGALRQGQLQVRADTGPAGVTVAFVLACGDDPAKPASAKGYRAITWRDVQALADAEGVECHLDAGGAQFVLPVVEAPPRNGAERRWG